MKRREFLERNIVQIYGGFPSDDAEITYDLLNSWLPDAISNAAKQCYVESIKLDGIAYVNNSFYTTFSGLAITTDDTSNQGYEIELPEIPVGLGRNEGIATLQFKDSSGFVSLPAIPLSMNQIGYVDSMPIISNKILYWPEGKYLRMKSSLLMTSYTGVVKMISGGDSSDLNSELNVPPDYHAPMVEYLKQQMAFEKAQKPDVTNDGNDMA